MKKESEIPTYPPRIIVRAFEKLRYFLLRLNRKFTHPNVVLMEMVQNFWLASAIGVVAELGIADLLSSGSKSIGDLAQSTATDEVSLYRIMRMLATQGIFREKKERYFESTPLARPLQEDQIRHFIMIHLSPGHIQMFSGLMTSVKTGNHNGPEVDGSELFEFIGDDQIRNERFNLAMTNASAMQVGAIIPAFPFKRFRKIIDIGGGQGLFMAVLLGHAKKSNGVVFDLPKALERTGEVIKKYSLEARMQAIEGDFFNEVPEGGDLYILKSVLHDWNDAEAEKILKSIHQAMDNQSRLLVIESVLDEGNSPSVGKMTDILMMVSAGGKERTRAEFSTLLDRSGFRIRKIHRTISPLSLIEALKI